MTRWVLGVMIVMAATAVAGETAFRFSDGVGDVLHGGLAATAVAQRDTTVLLGGPGRWDGRFETLDGRPDWHGWTHVDPTYVGVARWHVSSFHSPTGTPAMWCGAEFSNDCGAGYGNNWEENLHFARAVADPSVATAVRLQAVVNYDTEPDFDYFRVQHNAGGQWQDLVPPMDGIGVGVIVDASVTFQPGDYAGPQEDEIQLRFQGYSDGAWSDEDCLWGTVGLAQIDDVRVTVAGETFFDDFDDGTSRHWFEVEEPGCGDFAQIWSGLQDIDPCAENRSPQVAFIDDGVVVPGTGGTPCVRWCYGPGGYVVNWHGGLQESAYEYAVENLVMSPPLAMPAGHEGALFSFDAYRHADLNDTETATFFYQWHVRSVASGDPADLDAAPWADRNLWYYGVGYHRHELDLGDLLVPGCTHLQVSLRVFHYRPLIYWPDDATPAPYFDNVCVKSFPISGPAITAAAVDLAQDSFPQSGVVDLANLASNAVRFDMNRDIAPSEGRFDAGDSLVVDVTPIRAGSSLEGLPRMVVKVRANPLFDDVRVLPAGFTQQDGVIDGAVFGRAISSPFRFAFDLPDSTFLFPGDVVHYYVEGRDRVGADVGLATLPADLTGFGDFAEPLAYDGVFTMRALPSLADATGDQPRILFVNDAAGRGRDAHWLQALRACGAAFDQYATDQPNSQSSGIAGRATAATLAGYSTLLYASGSLSGPDAADASLLAAWLGAGGKHALFAGDDVAAALSSGPLAPYAGVARTSDDVRPAIDGQISPRVVPVAGASVFDGTTAAWIAACCPFHVDIDAMIAGSGTERLAEFTNGAGMPSYSYAAATRRIGAADVVVLPHDLAAVQNAPGENSAARAEVLRAILAAFGEPLGEPVGVPTAGVLTVSAAPNPFNPRTLISLDLPGAGEVVVTVFDVRGRVVRTLHRGRLDAGRHELVWPGTDDAGRAAASGVYFYTVQTAADKRIGKCTLVR